MTTLRKRAVTYSPRGGARGQLVGRARHWDQCFMGAASSRGNGGDKVTSLMSMGNQGTLRSLAARRISRSSDGGQRTAGGGT
ncbi:hypothetical protein E2C01_063232 [Portunus trituberculatus]|uniref:Uncharacterized protein n=1 Tax=Portunus trituberculatus TaxID=210409 RepID=A0A5B7H9Y1_PORTR|nr:hypothetical protein [Portunus trituberculatus]